MITFTIALVVLILGYWIYGSYVNRVFGPDNRQTPALTKADGVDYIPLPNWKIFIPMPFALLNTKRITSFFSLCASAPSVQTPASIW